jgi:hypothetical protein
MPKLRYRDGHTYIDDEPQLLLAEYADLTIYECMTTHTLSIVARDQVVSQMTVTDVTLYEEKAQ